MRSFDERRAEIFRRSAQRIQKRRRTARYALLCIPLVLCLSALSLLIPQQRLLPDEESSLPIAEVAVAVQQENTDFRRESTDTEQIATLSSALRDAMVSDLSDGLAEETASDAQSNALNTDQAPTTGRTNKRPQTLQTHATQIEGGIVEYGCYIITFTTQRGDTVTYRLGNKTLTEMTTDTTVTLTDETAATLRALVEKLS